jgi:hypothetical protein
MQFCDVDFSEGDVYIPGMNWGKEQEFMLTQTEGTEMRFQRLTLFCI